MNSFDRVFNRLEGKSVDRLPNMCLVMAFAAKQIGVSYSEYVKNGKVLADGVWHCYENFGIDALCVISDPMREAEGFGAKVLFPEDGVPHSPQPLLQTIQDISKLRISDPSKCARMNDRLNAVRILSERSKNEVPVVGWVEGALAESCDLMGVSEFMVNMLDEEDAIHELLLLCTEQAALFAKEQIKAGAQIIGVGDAAASLIGPSLYEEFALPYQQKLINSIHQYGAKAKLHICGNLNPILNLVAQTGADIIDLDHMVDMKKAAEILPKTSNICGNFNPVSVLLQGSTEDVCNAIKICREIENSNNIIISSGCEVPKFTPDCNMNIITSALF